MKPGDTSTNSELSALESELESAILNDLRLLDLDCHRAIDELRRHCGSLDQSFKEGAERLEGSAKLSADSLRKVQKRLGELNYLLAEENIDDPEVMKAYKDRILSALENAETELNKLADTFLVTGDLGIRFIKYTKLFRERLELVRVHLLHDADVISRGFNQIREAMKESSSTADQEGRLTLHGYLSNLGEDTGNFFNVFFQNPDVCCRPESWDPDN